jgi:hypothetical protein
MRVTKRFAGASSLRKEIRSSCGKSKFTPQEIEAARMDIERLEERLMLTLGRRPGAALLPKKNPASIGGSVTSSPQYSNTSCAPATSGCLGSGAINPSQMTNAQDLFFLFWHTTMHRQLRHCLSVLRHPVTRRLPTSTSMLPPLQRRLPQRFLSCCRCHQQRLQSTCRRCYLTTTWFNPQSKC